MTTNATATIGGSADIHTTGSVAVASLVNAENTSISATSAAVSNSVNDPSAGDTSKQSCSVGLAIGNFDWNSLATVGSDVTYNRFSYWNQFGDQHSDSEL